MSEPKYGVEVKKNVLIPLRDGISLAADVYKPNEPNRFPAVISFYPYRKDDFASQFEEILHYFAQRGYASILVDIRGTGGSDGASTYILSSEEQQDGYEAIEWIAQQKWCDGNVGQWGTSYGGFTSLLYAAQNPPHLKAIVPMMTTAYLYEDLNPGGSPTAFLGNYGSLMTAMNFMPPAFADPEGRWMKIWGNHLKDNVPWVLSWLDHPMYDSVWKEGTLHHRYDRIKVPVFIIGGWRDIYPDIIYIFRGLKVPKKAIIGPWMHGSPQVSTPGPQIDFLHEMLRWWDHWLKGIDTGIMDEPPVTIFVQGADKWRFENEWPIRRTADMALYLGPKNALGSTPSGDKQHETYDYHPALGTNAGLWDSLLGIGMPLDQRPDEALSLVYTTEPLDQDLEITGSPVLTLHASSSADVAAFVAKLCDVTPDGSSNLVTSGWLNATHRMSHEKAIPLVPNQIYKLTIRLCSTSYMFKEKHRIRLDISSSDFPRMWPSPKPAVNAIYYGRNYVSHLVLPTIPKREPSSKTPKFRPSPGPSLGIRPPRLFSREIGWKTTRDLLAHTVTVSEELDDRMVADVAATSTGRFTRQIRFDATVSARDPAEVCSKGMCDLGLEHKALGDVNVRARTIITTHNAIVTVDVLVNGAIYFNKTWTRSCLPWNAQPLKSQLEKTTKR